MQPGMEVTKEMKRNWTRRVKRQKKESKKAWGNDRKLEVGHREEVLVEFGWLSVF